ncbi:MAG: DNA mismatch repair endonuclease MutL [Pirellulales bacterium]
MPVIRQLSPSVINKIAAGEVIERPASAVKELLENAVDAGATRIEVSVDRGGTDRIRISDDGCGIEPDQLMLAIDSHATSKIESADDLFAVNTLGFRGEALASIAEVSRFRIRSRVADRPDGAQLEVIGGERSEVSPASASVGTVVEVEDLFFNTPVRRKFLKAVQTEFAHVSEAFARVALPYPDRGFTLIHNGRLVYDLPPVTDWRERILALFGPELADGLIWIDNQDRGIRLSGYVADPAHSRGHNKMQYLFLNGRYIRDRALQHALGESYRGLLLQGRHPIAFLRMEMPPEVIDVNVHPCKLEVRFQDSGQLYSQLLGTLRAKFLSADLTARVQAAHQQLGPHGQVGGAAASPSAVVDASAVTAPVPRELFRPADHARPITPWPISSASTAPPSTAPTPTTTAPIALAPTALAPTPMTSPAPGAGAAPGGGAAPWPVSREAQMETFSPNRPAADGASADNGLTGGDGPLGSEGPWNRADAQAPGESVGSVSAEPGRVELPGREPGARTMALQAQNRYLITEGPGGLEIIDQHALHERILFEELRGRILSGRMEKQRLLVPETVQLVPTEAAAVLENRSLLADLGLDVEDFGGGTVVVSSYPAMLGRVNPVELLRQVAQQLVADAKVPDRRDLLDHLMATMACKAAVKAGDRLTEQEIAALLERRFDVQDSHHCPHGRPTTLVFSREELDRRFKRI